MEGEVLNIQAVNKTYNVTVNDTQLDRQTFFIDRKIESRMIWMKHALEREVKGTSLYLNLQVNGSNPSWVAGFWEKSLATFNFSFQEMGAPATFEIKRHRFKCRKHPHDPCGFPGMKYVKLVIPSH